MGKIYIFAKANDPLIKINNYGKEVIIFRQAKKINKKDSPVLEQTDQTHHHFLQTCLTSP